MSGKNASSKSGFKSAENSLVVVTGMLCLVPFGDSLKAFHEIGLLEPQIA